MNANERNDGCKIRRIDCQISLTSKFKNHGLGQYGAEPHYCTLPFWQLCASKG